MEKDKSKANWFVRSLIIALVIYLLALTTFKFLFGSPAFSLNTETIIIVFIIVILVLSESFNKFSIGELFSVTREIEKKDKELQVEKKANEELRQNIITLTSSIVQVSSANSSKAINVFGDLPIKTFLGVTDADQKAKAIDEEEEKVVEKETPKKDSPMFTFRFNSALEKYALSKFTKELALPDIELRSDIQIRQAFTGIDPIVNRNAVFDGYLQTPISEIFIEVRTHNRTGALIFDRLYFQISQVQYYRNVKNIPAFMILLIINLPDTDIELYGSERLNKMFEPAIKNGLLKIVEIQIDNSELDNIKKSMNED